MQIPLFCIGASAIFLWGFGHLIPTRNIVSGFGELSADNRRIITMEWLMEGVTLCFLGVLVLVLVFIVGAVSFITGGRTTILPMKLCAYVKVTVGITYIVASLL